MAAAHRRGAERTARSPTSERASEAVREGRRPRRPARRASLPPLGGAGPAGFAAGAAAGRSPTPRQVSGVEAGGAAREARGGSTGVSWPLPGRSGPGDAGGGEEETGAGGGPPSRPHSRRATASPSPAETAVYNGIRTKIRRHWGRDLSVTEWPFLEDSFVLSLGPRAAAPDRCGSPCQDPPPLGFLVRYQEGFMIVESMNESN